MSRILVIVGLGLWIAFALQSLAEDSSSGTDAEFNHYSGAANAWVEGTLTKANSDGAFGVRGAESSYARDYASFNRQFFAYSSLTRESHRQELLNDYGDRLKYAPEKLGTPKDFSFTGGNLEKRAIFEEPRYGRDPNSWSYRSDPKPFRFDELRMGDRVVVGYDSYDNSVLSIMLINPLQMNALDIPPK